MASPLTKGITAIKRTRSTSSLPHVVATDTSLAPSPDNAAQEASSDVDVPPVPAFLRQSEKAITTKHGLLDWQEKIRLLDSRTNPQSLFKQDVSVQNSHRNRYYGINAFDSTRVKLKVEEGLPDYINASWIKLRDPVSSIESNFIATQGPKEDGVDDFWQMVWNETEDVAVIVMLTPTTESGREKCFQYFPMDSGVSPYRLIAEGHSDQLEDGEIAYVDLEEQGPNTQVRKLKLSYGDKSKDVWHLLFTAFPDFGVPDKQDRAELLDLIRLSAVKNTYAGNPRIVHCSAGVGRTGTFISVEYLLSLLASGTIEQMGDSEDPIFDLVTELRLQRMTMVQSISQYQFLHDILLEELEKKQHDKQPDLPSSKLRRLNGGSKANAVDDTETKDPTPDLETDGSKDADSDGSEVYEDANDEIKGSTTFTVGEIPSKEEE